MMALLKSDLYRTLHARWLWVVLALVALATLGSAVLTIWWPLEPDIVYDGLTGRAGALRLAGRGAPSCSSRPSPPSLPRTSPARTPILALTARCSRPCVVTSRTLPRSTCSRCSSQASSCLPTWRSAGLASL